MSYIGNTPFTAAFLTDTFSGNGTTVAFTMSVAPANTSSILVAVTGVLQDPSTYSVSGTTLTFSAAPPSGTNNISVRYLGIPASGVTTTAYRTQTEFTATAGQTTFTVPSYTVGYIDVYRNGLLLGSADFTATTGTTVVLANACAAGDFVETVSFYVSSVLNAIPATAGSIGQTYLAGNVGATGPSFRATTSTTQSFSINTVTKATIYTVEQWDTNSNYDNSACRFTPTVAGYYQINAGIQYGSLSTTSYLLLYKNGSLYQRTNNISAAAYTPCSLSSLVYMNGTTDYLEIYFECDGSGSPATYQDTSYNYFNGAMVRAA